MKQYITKEQWDELNKKQKSALRKFWDLPEMIQDGFAGHMVEDAYRLSIGKMIEFLGDELNYLEVLWNEDGQGGYGVYYGNDNATASTELADALWEAVKDKLK